MAVYNIKRAVARGSKKNLILKNQQGKESSLSLHRFAMVGPGDEVRVVNTPDGLKITRPNGRGKTGIAITPHFQSHHEIRFGEERLKIVLSEIISAEEYESYQHLEQFHYKGINLHKDPEAENERNSKAIGGRRALLLAIVQRSGFNRAVGYIEIQMPLMMAKPRHVLFDRPFRHTKSGISWVKWLKDGQRYTNLIARIARVVVDPEFRGIGISTLLVEGAKAFCSERWHIGGEKPIFLEISAEMLRYIDFVSRAGFHFIGYTEGNLGRIAQDLDSIQKGASGKSGIMSLQRKYHSAFTSYCEKTGRSFDEAQLILSELLQSSDPRSMMASDEWLAFRPILRLPIPYYMIGLDAEADAYIKDGIRLQHNEHTQHQPNQHQIIENGELTAKEQSPIFDLHKLEIWLDYKIQLSPYVRLVMDSFGIETHQIRSRLVGPVDIAMNPGNVYLVTGASGAGKSVLLQAISGHNMPNGLVKAYKQDYITGTTRMLSPLPEGVPIFQYFAETYGPDKAFSALCQVGLSEAMIFIKPFEILSMGQRYRAMFADLILSDAQTWLIDEFCSNLDPITAKIISIRLRRLALRNNRFVIVAAANTEHFINALSPDRILVVRTGGNVVEMRMREYINGFFNKGF